jgi:hypothetical protein
LVWTTADRVARLRESVGDEAESRRGESLGVGATLIVDSPFERRGMNEAAPPVESPGDFVMKDGPDGAWQRAGQVGNAEGRAPISQDFQEGAGGSLTDELEFANRPLITRTRVLLGVVAVVLVGALIAVLYQPTKVSKRPIPPVQNQTGEAESTDQKTAPATGTVAEPAVGSAAEPEIKKPQQEPATVPPPAKKPVVVSQLRTLPNSTDNRVKNKKEKEPVQAGPEAEPSVTEFGGLSQRDIPRLLEMAKKDAGDGNYEKARGEYQTILKLQANNPDAKEGLRKLSIIQGDKDQ